MSLYGCRKGQYDSSCRVVEDLTDRVERYRREQDESAMTLDACRKNLQLREQNLREVQHHSEQLTNKCRSQEQQILQYQVYRIALFVFSELCAHLFRLRRHMGSSLGPSRKSRRNYHLNGRRKKRRCRNHLLALKHFAIS